MRGVTRPISILLTLAVFTACNIGGAARAQSTGFTCGPYARTYLATNENTFPSVAVRCAVMIPSAPRKPTNGRLLPLFVWFGEGWANSPSVGPAVALGAAYAGAPEAPVPSYWPGVADAQTRTLLDATTANLAFPPNGNYERINHVRFALLAGSWRMPRIMSAASPCGCIQEQWHLESSIPFTPLPVPSACNLPRRYPHFGAYRVHFTGATGSALSCVLTQYHQVLVWMSHGVFDGKTFTQIGYRTPHGYAAVDLCGPSFGTRCKGVNQRSPILLTTGRWLGRDYASIRLHIGMPGASWTEQWVRT